VAVAGEAVDQLGDGGADDRASPGVQGPDAECTGHQGPVTLMLRRVHLQDGPAHDLPHRHCVAGGGEPCAVGENLPGALVAEDGEQQRDPRRLLIQPVPPGPGGHIDLHHRRARPDVRQHRIGVSHIPGELGELPHRIVAELGRTVAPRRHDHARPLPGPHARPANITPPLIGKYVHTWQDASPGQAHAIAGAYTRRTRRPGLSRLPGRLRGAGAGSRLSAARASARSTPPRG
jgi:hypothetical protein